MSPPPCNGLHFFAGVSWARFCQYFQQKNKIIDGAVRYGTVQYGTVRYGTVRYGAVECRAWSIEHRVKTIEYRVQNKEYIMRKA